MNFDPSLYGPQVARILALGGDGCRRMPLVMAGCTSPAAREALAAASAEELFPRARAAGAALSGLWLYFGCFDESHRLSQDIATPEGSYWHGILHRQEPDPGNAAYWFRRVGPHPVFEALYPEAGGLLAASGVRWSPGDEWDPFAFIDFCESARRRPGSAEEDAALAIQLAEWQLLFDYCARAG